MSKSKGNTVEPWQVLDTYGADAFRWYFFTSKQPWDGYRFSEEAIGEGVRLFLKQLWSTYFFYVLYAHARRRRCCHSQTAHSRRVPTGTSTAGRSRARRPPRELVAERLDAYDATDRGPRDRRARGRAVQLVRAPLTATLLGRRPGGVRRRCASAC